MSSYTSETKNVGEYRCESTFVPGGKVFATDLPQSFGGKEEYPSPGALLGSAIASCMMSMVSYVAGRKGIDITGIIFKATPVEKDGKFTAFKMDVTVPLPGDCPDRELLEKSAMSCPVKNAIDPAIDFIVNWTWQ